MFYFFRFAYVGSSFILWRICTQKNVIFKETILKIVFSHFY